MFLSSTIYKFDPTHIIFNDSLPLKPTSLMLLPADVRRIFIVHTAEQLPFGPFCGAIPGSACSPREHKLLQGVDGTWSVSRTIQEYASTYGGLETTFLFHHPWNYLIGEDHELPRRRRNWGKGLVTMINPCPVKGSDILIGVARRCPDLNFLVLSSWGIDENPHVKRDLEALPNVK
jgi:hypothetical protein